MRLEPVKMDTGARETCLPGTRRNFLNNLVNYLTDPSLPPGRNIIWLRGPPGSGKSALLNTVAQHFSELRRRGAFLSWDRNGDEPLQVFRTLAFQLASFNSTFAARLVAQIEKLLDAAFPLNAQFQRLVGEPLAKLARDHDLGPVVIVLDGLDEFGTAELRRKLLSALSAGLAKLPATFRVLIASQDDPDIRTALSSIRVDTWDVPIGDEPTASDISQFFRQWFNKIISTHDLPPNWPGEQVVRRLVDLADGLFMWASTAVHLISSGDPEEMLCQVLEVSERDPSLDALYRFALTHAFRTSDESKLNDARSILGAILSVFEQVTDDQISQLLGLKLGAVQDILSQLRPLIRWDPGRPIQLRHTSLSGFLCHPNRRQDMPWLFDTHSHYHDKLTAGCFGAMERDLKFNICGIETSYYRNKEIDGIQERVDRVITPALMYASRYWADHLELVSAPEPGSHPFGGAVINFIHHRFLYWIEVFSVKDQMSMIPRILLKVVSWVKVCQLSHVQGTADSRLTSATQRHELGLEAIISEAQNFVDAFEYPMGQSVPHIYLSALSFSPSESVLLRHMRDAFQNTLFVEGGGSEQSHAIHQTFGGHSGPVWSVAFSPDSTRIISGSGDTTIRIWDAGSGAAIGEPLQGHADLVCSVAFSPDGARAISGSYDRTVRIWDVVSSTPIGEPLRGHTSSVQSVVFSPDNARIISGSCDKTVRIWDAVSGAPIGEPLRGHSDIIHSVAPSPDGARIASGSSDNTVRIWDAMSGAPIGEPLRGHSDWVLSVAYSPNGTLIISSSFDKTARIWDAKSGAPISELLQYSSSFRSVAFSPDGTCIVSGAYDGTIRIWNAISGTPIGKPVRGNSGPVRSVAYSPDGACIVSGSDNGHVQLWGIVPGVPIIGPVQGHSRQIKLVAFSPDNASVVSCSGDMTVRIWDATTGAPIGEALRGHSASVYSIAFSPDGTRIISGSYDNTIRIWDSVSGMPIGEPLQGHSHLVQSIAFSPDGTRIVSGSCDKTVRIWDAVSGAPIGDPLRGHFHRVQLVAFSPDGSRIISASDKTIQIWDVMSGTPTGERLQVVHSDRMRFSPGNTCIISASDNRTIRIWNSASSSLTLGLPEGDSSSVRSAARSPDTHKVSPSDDRTVQSIPPFEGDTISAPHRAHSSFILSNTSSSRDANGAAIFPDGSLLHDDGWVTADGRLLFWVPPEHYVSLFRPNTVTLIGTPPAQLNMSRFVHGPRWMECQTGI